MELLAYFLDVANGIHPRVIVTVESVSVMKHVSSMMTAAVMFQTRAHNVVGTLNRIVR